MSKLTGKQRKALPTSDFAVPGRKYPVPDASHARDALSRVSANGTPAEQAMVRRKVAGKFPGINVTGSHKSPTMVHEEGP